MDTGRRSSPLQPTSGRKHALTIDVEDYFQVAAFFDVIDRDEWERWPRRVDFNTRALLDLLEHHGYRATFFVLGWVAEREPALVRAIAERGHEVASHGYSHEFIYRQSPETFRQETSRSKKMLEDLTGGEIRGYRAASYSVTADSVWALEIIHDEGFRYDSSIFPVHHDNYGMPGAPILPHRALVGDGSLLEFPITTARLGGLRVPAGGGGYFRLYPYGLSRKLVRRHELQREDPFVFYLHPWEVDPDQPRVPGAGWRSRLRHYLNLKRCRPRLERLLEDFDFCPLGDHYDALRERLDLPRHRYGR